VRRGCGRSSCEGGRCRGCARWRKPPRGNLTRDEVARVLETPEDVPGPDLPRRTSTDEPEDEAKVYMAVLCAGAALLAVTASRTNRCLNALRDGGPPAREQPAEHMDGTVCRRPPVGVLRDGWAAYPERPARRRWRTVPGPEAVTSEGRTRLPWALSLLCKTPPARQRAVPVLRDDARLPRAEGRQHAGQPRRELGHQRVKRAPRDAGGPATRSATATTRTAAHIT